MPGGPGRSESTAGRGHRPAPVGVTENEIAAIDLSKENVKLDQRRLRIRHMEIQPGGIVPLHSHADRPALIMVTAGQIYENNSKCLVPILHHAGDIRANTWARALVEERRQDDGRVDDRRHRQRPQARNDDATHVVAM